MDVILFVHVCVRWGSKKKVGGDWAKNFVLFMVHGGCRETENRILDFSWCPFCWFLIFFCLNLSKNFHLTKITKFFGGDKMMQKVLYLQGRLTKLFLLSQTSLSFVLKNVESIVLFAKKLNGSWLKHPIKNLLLLMSHWFINWCQMFCLYFPS